MDRDLLAFVTGLDPKEAQEVVREENQAKGIKKTGRNEKKGKTVLQKSASFDQGFEGSLAGLADFASVLTDETGFVGLKRQLGAIAGEEDAHKLDAAGLDSRKKKKSWKNPSAEDIPLIEAPLPRMQQDKIEREAAYIQTNKEISKWQPIVQHNRQQKTLVFPLNAPPSANITTTTLAAGLTPKTPLEMEISTSLRAAGIETEGDICRLEQMEMNKLTATEVEARFADLAKKRSLLFFKERKQRHQAKIKSKKYRKIKSREKAKTAAIDEAKSTSEERRIKAELARVKERLTLKSRKSSKWAQEMLHRRHIDPNSKQEIIDQLRDKERLRQEIFGKAADLKADNETESEYEYEEEDNRRIDDDYIEDDDESNYEDVSDNGNDNVDDEEGFVDESGDQEDDDIEEREETVVPRQKFGVEKNQKGENLEPKVNEFEMVVRKKGNKTKPKMFSKATTTASSNRQELFQVAKDDPNVAKQQEIIKAAFVNDDLFAEFAAEKDTIIEADAPKTIDLTLPGWGSWAGEGISAASQVKVLLKPKADEGIQARKRKDWGLKHVIINERQNKKANQLLTVPKVPFPYKSKEEYERAVLGKPLGPEWNAATTFKKRIQPRVQVKVGSIIDPIKFIKQPKTA